jgi:hypothetical protein
MFRVLSFLIVVGSLIFNAAVASALTCEDLGLKSDEKIESVATDITDWVSLKDVTQTQENFDLRVAQLRNTTSVEFLEETAEEFELGDLTDDMTYAKAMLEVSGSFSQPLFRTLTIKGKKYDEVEIAFGGGDWEESTLFFHGSSKSIGIDTYDGKCP